MQIPVSPSLRLDRTSAPVGFPGGRILDSGGQEIGQVEDWLAVSDSVGETCAVASFEPVLGRGDALFPIPLRALAADPESGGFRLHLTRSRIAGAPGFLRSHWPQAAGLPWLEAVYHYHGQALGTS